jgi:hypothetical protein
MQTLSSSPTQPTPSSCAPYAKPKLVRMGQLASLTQGGFAASTVEIVCFNVISGV